MAGNPDANPDARPDARPDAVADALIVDDHDTLLVRGAVTMALVPRAVSDPARG